MAASAVREVPWLGWGIEPEAPKQPEPLQSDS